MKKAGADVHVIAALDDVCWITNLRGDDVDSSHYYFLMQSSQWTK